jgi:hypothetical protein
VKASRRSQGREPALDLSAISLPLVDGIPLYRGDLEEDLRIVGRHHLAEQITGGLSEPSKMPCPAWGIPASRCPNGSRLAEQAGTTCAACYARRGRYAFETVQAKLEERYQGLFHPLWVPAMVFLVRWHAAGFFRWFDSGDLQGESHLRNICTVVRHTPDIRHWLPTREYEVLRACRDEIPENLTVRVSATHIDGPPPSGWPTTSTVIRGPEAGESICPAPENGGGCGACRDCWDPDVANVAYRLH